MGLADALFAGLGQGLQAGATNYVDGLQRQQQMDIQKQQAANQQAEAQRQATTYDEQQANARMGGLQTAGLAAHRAGNDGLAASYLNQVPAQFQKAYGITGVSLPAPVVGSPVAATSDLPISYGGAAQAYSGQDNPTGPVQGTNAQGGLTGLAAGAPKTFIQPGIPAHNDFSGKQTQDALQAVGMITPQTSTLKYGEEQNKVNPWTGEVTQSAANEHQFNPVQRVSGGYLTTDEEGNTVFTPSGGHYRSGASGIYNTNDGTVTPGTAPAGRGVLKPYTDPTDGVIKYGYFTPDGKMIPTGAQAPSTAGRGSPATDAKQSQLLLQNVQDLSTKYGAPITSYGIRPVGSPGDTGKTIVNGHQTQYGLRYEYEHNGGPLAAIPGQSAHGNGMAVDIAVPRDAAGAKAAFTQRGLQVLDEGDHWHITAAGPLAPVAKPAKQSAAMSLLGGAAAGTPANDAGTQALMQAAASLKARQDAAAAAAKAAQR